jgi:hypothetical protein
VARTDRTDNPNLWCRLALRPPGSALGKNACSPASVSVGPKDWAPAAPYDAQDVGVAPVGVAEQRPANAPHDGPWDVVTGPGLAPHMDLLHIQRNLDDRAKCR